MAFHSLMLQLVADLRTQLRATPSVVELGNQTFKPRAGDFERVTACLLAQGAPFDATLLREIAARSDSALSASTSDYYRALGFASYRTIDVNSRYDSLVMDLNRDLAGAYGFHETFDLVTNNGTSEHIFNQSAVFSNAHALCKVGGMMLHVLPFVNYLNHGFFGYNPILFYDLASANDYEVCRLSVASNRGIEIDNHSTPELRQEELQERCAIDGSLRGSFAHLLGVGRTGKRGRRVLSTALRRLMSVGGPNISVVALLRKTHGHSFRFPIQGMYGGENIAEPALRGVYSTPPGARE